MTAKNEVVFLQDVDNILFANERIVADLGEARSWPHFNARVINLS